jgi:hypothetical protein
LRRGICPTLYIRRPPAVLITCLECREPSTSGIEQQDDSDPDQIDDAKVVPPPRRESVERRHERCNVPVHYKGEKDDQPVYDVQMEEVEEEGYASKDDKKA